MDKQSPTHKIMDFLSWQNVIDDNCPDKSFRGVSSSDFLPWRDDFDKDETAEIKQSFVSILVGSGTFGWPCWSIGSQLTTRPTGTFDKESPHHCQC